MKSKHEVTRVGMDRRERIGSNKEEGVIVPVSISIHNNSRSNFNNEGFDDGWRYSFVIKTAIERISSLSTCVFS